jgi:hypothetical protein
MMQSRRNFFFKSTAALAAAAIPSVIKGNTIPQPCDTDWDNIINHPVAQQLKTVVTSPNGKAVAAFLANFYTGPILVTLATKFLNDPTGGLSAFQKDIYRTFLTASQYPSPLNHLLNGVPLTLSDINQLTILSKIFANSPSFLTLQAAAAELKIIPALAPVLQDSIADVAAAFGPNYFSIYPMETGTPELNTIIQKVYNFAQQPLGRWFSNTMAPIVLRPDFADFLKLLPPAQLGGLLSLEKVIGFQLPIDAPDDVNFLTLATSIAGTVLTADALLVAGGILGIVTLPVTGWIAVGLSAIGAAALLYPGIAGSIAVSCGLGAFDNATNNYVNSPPLLP